MTKGHRLAEFLFRVAFFIFFGFIVFLLIPIAIFGAYVVISNFTFFGLVHLAIGFYGFLNAWRFIRNRHQYDLKWFTDSIKRLRIENRLEASFIVLAAVVVLFLILTGIDTSLDEFFQAPKIRFHPLIPFLAVLPVYLTQNVLFPVGVFTRISLGLPWVEPIFSLVPIILESLFVYFTGRGLGKAAKRLRFR